MQFLPKQNREPQFRAVGANTVTGPQAAQLAALIHGTIDWHPLTGTQRPSFKTELWITPDGVHTESTETGANTVPWGLTWPLLINDGRPLVTTIGSDIASTAYSDSGDRESFLSIAQSAQNPLDLS